MRGQVDPQSGLFSYFSVEERIPADHPLRRVKAQADAVLGSMGPRFDAMYAAVGRRSVAPERLLKATLLIPAEPRNFDSPRLAGVLAKLSLVASWKTRRPPRAT